MVEKELKVLITREEYQKVMQMFSWDKNIVQENYYYVNPENIDFENTFRVRKIENKYKLQIKRTMKKDKSLHIKKEYECELETLPERISSDFLNEKLELKYEECTYSCVGSLKTDRKVMKTDAVELCLDKNYYLANVDYELEIEYQNSEPLDLIAELRDAGISFEKGISGKNTRFLKRYVEQQSKRLPFVVPEVCNYPFFTALLGILSAHGKEKGWLYSNYLLLWCYENTVEFPYWVDFKFGDENKMEELCPNITKKTVFRKDVLDKYESVIDFVKESIDGNQYLFVSYDPYYIEEYWTTLKMRRHIKHQCLVVGYNDSSGKVAIADFFAGKYRVIEIGYDVFEKCYKDFDLDESKVDADHCTNIELLSINEASDQIDYQRIINFLDDFINSKDETLYNGFLDENSADIYTGFKFLEKIGEYINGRTADKEYLDEKCFYIIERFVHIFFDRIEYLEIEGKELNELAGCTIKMSEKIMRNVLVYNVARKDTAIEKIINDYYELKEIIKIMVMKFNLQIKEKYDITFCNV